MQATAVAGPDPAVASLAPAPPDADSSQGADLSIDRNDRAVVTAGFPTAAGSGSKPVERQYRVGLGVAASFARTAVLVALASLAILVLLPAAIAAQATSAI
jgi:hypothetical protein